MTTQHEKRERGMRSAVSYRSLTSFLFAKWVERSEGTSAISRPVPVTFLQ